MSNRASEPSTHPVREGLGSACDCRLRRRLCAHACRSPDRAGPLLTLAQQAARPRYRAGAARARVRRRRPCDHDGPQQRRSARARQSVRRQPARAGETFRPHHAGAQRARPWHHARHRAGAWHYPPRPHLVLQRQPQLHQRCTRCARLGYWRGRTDPHPGDADERAAKAENHADQGGRAPARRHPRQGPDPAADRRGRGRCR